MSINLAFLCIESNTLVIMYSKLNDLIFYLSTLPKCMITIAEAYNPTIEWVKLESSKMVKDIEQKKLLRPKLSFSKGYLRVVCLSDTHGVDLDAIEIPDGDILIHAGDFSKTGELEHAEKLNTLFGTLPHRYKIVIAGNHDITFHRGWYEKNFTRYHSTMKSVSKARKTFNNAIYLEEDSIVIEGYKIFGSPVGIYHYYNEIGVLCHSERLYV